MNRLSRILATAATIAVFSANSVAAQTTATSTTIKVITPGENQTIYGNKIPILFAVENFQLTDFQKTPTAARGQGHIHVWLDESNPTKDSARKVMEDTTTYYDVPYGEHTLKAELVGNNHASLTPPVTSTIKFKSSPAASPSPAVTSGFDKNTALVILVVVALVIVAAWWYTKEEDETPEAPTKPKSVKKKTSRRKTRK